MAREGDEGQMMILTAVILLAAFLALSAMLARVGNLAAETQNEQEDPFAMEFQAVVRGVERTMADHVNTTSEFALLEDALAHIERNEAKRGYWVRIDPGVPCSGSVMEMTLWMQDANTYAQRAWNVPVAGCGP